MQKLYDALNNARISARYNLGQFADLFGGKEVGGLSDPNHQMHADVSRNMTSKLGAVLPPSVAAGFADMAGLANESLSGALQKMVGRDFFSDGGFDWQDVSANRAGQDEAVMDLQVRRGTPNPLMEALWAMSGWNLADKAMGYVQSKK
jgi:hypothetical protein